jgi:CRP/FNR family cyclic AMP-dependent transcriptional regulator
MADDQLLERFVREFRRGVVLFQEGDPGREMYVLRNGRVTISRKVGDVEKVLSTLGQGEFFGEMSILTGRPRSATAAVVEDARILVIDARTFESMIRANAEIAIRMIKELAERLAWANDQISSLLRPDSSSRVVHWLVTAAERAAQGSGPVELPLSREQLPALVGVEPSQAEAVLEKLLRARLVSLVGKAIAIPEPARLRQLLEFLQMKAQFGDLA